MLIAVLFYLIREGFALPTPALDVNPSGFSQVAPNTSSTRSVPGIIWSCLTTIFTCTWVAVHPNIPSHHDSDQDLWWRRVKILAVALIAPEYIILWAANQLRSARRAVKELHNYPSCSDWTLTHGMFLVMGGFMLTKDSAAGEVIGVLQASELVTLLKENSIALPSISSSEIMDKSKGDVVSKTLVLVQTTWFMAQVISRAFQHLPITELEITTVAFASLNILTYILWWKKPLDVRHPILLSMQPRQDMEFSDPDALQEVSDIPFNNQMFQFPLQAVAGFSTDFFDANFFSDAFVSTRFALSRIDLSLPLPWSRERNVNTMSRESVQFLLNITTRMSPATQLDSTSFPNLKFTTRVPTFYGGPPLHISDFYPINRNGALYLTYLEMFLGAIFGAIHCIGWTFQFPTNMERVLWRTTSLCMTLVPLMFMTVVGVICVPQRYRLLKMDRILIPICAWINLVSFMAYIVARLGTFVLAFTLLRDLPLAALQELPWTTFIPHV
ncbi:hypothetical protein BDP27DRAFT_1298008 [Rhodocollybia butyracea]|uniref:Uncharacterized protein n=1 Tax=Rhodocollybia butyracea TaxID=206335 RepID=A0A9P5U4I7_9AGAR|nr:hypothetical protein BDP27DRAFT_1298008 [Rhodocollybia butyracea]